MGAGLGQGFVWSWLPPLAGVRRIKNILRLFLVISKKVDEMSLMGNFFLQPEYFPPSHDENPSPSLFGGGGGRGLKTFPQLQPLFPPKHNHPPLGASEIISTNLPFFFFCLFSFIVPFFLSPFLFYSIPHQTPPPPPFSKPNPKKKPREFNP